MKKKNSISSSRKKTPWDNHADLSVLEFFIQSVYHENYDRHHPILSETDEALLLNSYTLMSCKHCESLKIKKKGFSSNGVQRYYCNECKRGFTITTNTIFEDHKISISEWIEHCLNIMNYSSISLNSKSNKNAFTTSKYWLAKLFLILDDYQDDILLEGTIQLDEAYYSVIKSEQVRKIDGKLPRGLSKNKYCIGIACTDKHVYLAVEGKAKTSETKTMKTFEKHIKRGSHLIHDEEKAHNILVQELDLTSSAYNSKYLKTLNDEENPLSLINHHCFLLKKFLNAHSGFNRDELQGYLNFYAFITNPPSNKLLKVRYLLEKSLNSTKKLTYRDYYSKKHCNEAN